MGENDKCSGHDQLCKDIREIRKDIKLLIEFKGKILGIISFASVLVTLAFNFVSKLL